MKLSGHPESDAALSEDTSAEVHKIQGTSWLLVAHILRPQGRKGEVLADLLTDFPERFNTSPRVYLAKPGFSGHAYQAREANVLSFFLPVGKNSGRIALTIDGISSISAAETLNGLDVLVPYEERLKTDEDTSYVSDLIGCAVYDVPRTYSLVTPPGPETLIGVVDDVHFPTTPDGTRRLEDAAPLLSVLSPIGNEILIPYVTAYLVALELDDRRILMALPTGLVEVNT